MWKSENKGNITRCTEKNVKTTGNKKRVIPEQRFLLYKEVRVQGRLGYASQECAKVQQSAAALSTRDSDTSSISNTSSLASEATCSEPGLDDLRGEV